MTARRVSLSGSEALEAPRKSVAQFAQRLGRANLSKGQRTLFGQQVALVGEETMDIVSGVDDFEHCVQLAKEQGKWRAWREYYFESYRHVFDPMLEYLYMCPLEDVKPIVERMDFAQTLGNARRFVRDRGAEWVERLLDESERQCSVDSPYDVYLLVGPGRVDGTALPAETPFLYFGLELYDSPSQLWFLVPHEYNHLVRLTSLLGQGAIELDTISVGELVILEGLGTLFPLVLHGREIGPTSIVEAGMMGRDGAEYCLQHEERLFHEIQEIWDVQLTPELMRSYFSSVSGRREGRPEKIAYYVGSRRVGDLLNGGHDICQLTRMPTDDIVELWRGEQAAKEEGVRSRHLGTSSRSFEA